MHTSVRTKSMICSLGCYLRRSARGQTTRTNISENSVQDDNIKEENDTTKMMKEESDDRRKEEQEKKEDDDDREESEDGAVKSKSQSSIPMKTRAHI